MNADRPERPLEETAEYIPADAKPSDRAPMGSEETAEFSLGEQSSNEALGEQPDHRPKPPVETGSDQDISGPPLPRFGRYVLLEELGRGGMGEVYRALHTRLHKQVALKLLPTGKVTNRQARERFQREIQLISRLSHPNVVRLENAGEIDGQPFLVMEYVAGINLKQMITRLGPMRPADACQMVGQAALGLEHLHKHRLVHRDLKPSNLIFSTVDGSVKIADLGVARLAEGVSEITASGRIVGDPHYMAPEQIDGTSLDIRVDIYGLGCTLFTLLTGKPPFNEVAGDIPEVLKGHLHRSFPRLASRCPEAPASLQRLLDHMTARNPADRLPRPVDVANALAPFAVGADLEKLIKQLDPAFDAFDSGSYSGIHTAEHLFLRSAADAGELPRKQFKWLPLAVLAVIAATILVGVSLWWSGMLTR